MRVKRKFIVNQTEIDEIRQHNAGLVRDYVGHPNVPQMRLPDPIYDTYEWSFRIHQLNSFYVEKGVVNSEGVVIPAKNGQGDIMAGILYEGVVRLEYDPLVESKFNLALNGE